MPLQAATQPTTEGKGLGPVQQIFLGNFGAEAGKGAKYLKAAEHHHQQRNRIQPMRKSHRPGMLVDRLLHFAGLGRLDFDYGFMHSCLPRLRPAVHKT